MVLALDQRRRTALILGVALLVLALEVRAFAGLPHDDAFIAYRYAENLALGHGMVFNPGERVLGFTSPLHVLLAALLHVLVGHEALPRAMSALGCVAWTAQALVVYRLLAGGLGRVPAAAVALLLAVGGAGSAHWVALETNLAVALSLGALALAFEERWRTASFVVGLACLARPDAAIMAALLAGYGAWRLRARVLVPAGVFLGVVLPWVVFASVYFGSAVPVPLRVKFQRTGFLPYLEHLLREGTTTLLGVDDPDGWLLALTWAGAAAGAALLVRRERRLALLVAYGALHCASYLYLRPFRAHEWHLYPGLVVLGICVWALVTSLGGVGSVAVTAALLAGYVGRTAGFARSYPTDHWFGERDRTYRAAAKFLRESAQRGEQVAAVEVGTLGYFSNARMYDLGGLVTRDPVIARHPPRPYAWLAVDSHYPSLEPEEEKPIREWSGGFPLRVYRLR